MTRTDNIGLHNPLVPRRVVLFRALPGLGDMLCVVPALRALRAALPDSNITLLGLRQAHWFVRRFGHYLDGLLEFPGYPGIPERPVDMRALPAFFEHVHSLDFDLAIQMHGSGITSNPFAAMLGARAIAGFYMPGHYCPDEDRFLAWVEREPESLRYLRLLESLGVPSQGTQLEFPLNEDDQRELRAIPAARYLQPGEYICIHPGAREVARRWYPAHFAALADTLASRGLRVVLTGTAGEAELVEAVVRDMRTRPINLAGQTGLGAMAALLKGSTLLVCNDTGVSHLACALGVPSVVVFMATDPARWAPLDRRLHRVVSGAGAEEEWAPRVEQVLAQASELLEEIERKKGRAYGTGWLGEYQPVAGNTPG